MHETRGRAEVRLEVGVDRQRLEDGAVVVDCRNARPLDRGLTVSGFPRKLV